MRSWFGPAPAVLVFALVAVAMMTVGAGRASAFWQIAPQKSCEEHLAGAKECRVFGYVAAGGLNKVTEIFISKATWWGNAKVGEGDYWYAMEEMLKDRVAEGDFTSLAQAEEAFNCEGAYGDCEALKTMEGEFAAEDPAAYEGANSADLVVQDDTVTPPAQSVLENPTFIEEDVGEEGILSGEDGSAAAGLFEAAGVLPTLGAALVAFGAGFGIGQFICSDILEASFCWGDSSDGSTVGLGEKQKGGFALDKEGGELEYAGWKAGPVAPYTWVWEAGGAQQVGPFLPGYPTASCYEGKNETPPSADIGTWLSAGLSTTCGGVKVEIGAATRGASEGTKLSAGTKATLSGEGLTENTGAHYCPQEAPTTCTTSPPSNWPARLGKQLATGGAEPAVKNRLAEAIVAAMPGSGTSDPYATLTVPSCAGLTAPECVKVLEELGLTPSVAYLDWPEVTVEEPDLDEPILSLEAQAEKVQGLEPATGVKVRPGGAVTIDANPEEAKMPFIVPDDPAPGESEEAWFKKRVEPEAPGATVTSSPLAEVASDPAYDPSTVVTAVPKPGTELAPEAVSKSAPEFEVRTNPSTAPEASTSGWSPPAISAVSLAPFASVHIGCSSFPFGIFCWLKDGLTSWGPGGECPDLSLPFVSFGSGEDHFSGTHLETSTCGFEPAMEIIRPMLVVLACISLAAMFAYAALGIGGQGGGDD